MDQLIIYKDYCSSQGLFLVISLSSSVEKNSSSFSGGIRQNESFLLVSIINLTQSLMEEIADVINQIADMLVVDVEKKHPFQLGQNDNGISLQSPRLANIYSSALELIDKPFILPWSPSQLTSEATINRIRDNYGGNLSGCRVTVIGMGSIGFKVALGLVEQGCAVSCYSRSIDRCQRLVSAINDIKSPFTISSAISYQDIGTAIASSDCLVLAASSKNFIEEGMLCFRDISSAYILDVGKNSLTKNCFDILFETVPLAYVRLDIGPELVRYVSAHLHGDVLGSRPSKKMLIVNGAPKCLVSGGMVGTENCYVVDNVDAPNFLLGVYDEKRNYLPCRPIRRLKFNSLNELVL